MNILICAATSLEMPQDLVSTHPIEYLITGVGMSQTSYLLGKKFATAKPALAIQIGIAGTYNPKFQLGDVVLVKQDCFADLGARDILHVFHHLTEILPTNASNPFEQFVLEPDIKLNYPLWPLVKAITVNSIRGSIDEINETIDRYHPDIETMEGASFFAACITENIPCLQLRSISNRVEPRNKDHWNIPLALKNLQWSLAQLLKTVD